jgi:hypothetical protein
VLGLFVMVAFLPCGTGVFWANASGTLTDAIANPNANSALLMFLASYSFDGHPAPGASVSLWLTASVSFLGTQPSQ